LSLRAPDEPGAYELRYVLDQSKGTLARRPIEVLPISPTLDAPTSVGAGADFEVGWTSGGNPVDVVTIVPAGAEERTLGNWRRLLGGNPVKLRAPDEPGRYELRYLLDQSKRTLVRRPIEVQPISPTLEAPTSVMAGSRFNVGWRSEGNEDDFVTIVEAEAEEGSLGKSAVRLRSGNPLSLVAPAEPGAHDVRYVMSQSRRTLVAEPIEVVTARASLEAPEQVEPAVGFEVRWEGPDGPGDRICVAPRGAPDAECPISFATVRGDPASLAAPREAGTYEIRYLVRSSGRVLARRPLTVR
jgi:Ca-activated chloride channel family protein